MSRLAPWVAVTGSRVGLRIAKVNQRAGWLTYQAGKRLADLLTWRARRQWQRSRACLECGHVPCDEGCYDKAGAP